MKDKLLLVSVPVVFKKDKGKKEWFLVVHEKDGDWELPKTTVRKAESSVRAAIRVMAEQGGIKAKVLEEAGRSGGATRVNNKLVAQRFIYYLMSTKDSGEMLGFLDGGWFEYRSAVKKLKTKRDRQMLKEALKIAKEIEERRLKAKKKLV